MDVYCRDRCFGTGDFLKEKGFTAISLGLIYHSMVLPQLPYRDTVPLNVQFENVICQYFGRNGTEFLVCWKLQIHTQWRKWSSTVMLYFFLSYSTVSHWIASVCFWIKFLRWPKKEWQLLVWFSLWWSGEEVWPIVARTLPQRHSWWQLFGPTGRVSASCSHRDS
jgi:hypothetical protein